MTWRRHHLLIGVMLHSCLAMIDLSVDVAMATAQKTYGEAGADDMLACASKIFKQED